jgi:diguanylate cyclase (GGDEF)-like protein
MDSLMKNTEEIIKYTSKLHLLYVEDDKATLEASSFLLENFFKTITTAVNGKDGLEKFKNNNIDLIITDINMPYLNGLEMIAKIKEIDKDIKIIIFSANIEPKYFTESIKLGVDGYLLKPIDTEYLINTLENIVSSMRLRDEVEHSRQIEEQNHKHLQTIVDASRDPIMIIKNDYNIEYMSKSIQKSMYKLNIADINNPKCYEVSYRRDEPCDGLSHPCPLKDVIESKKSTTIIHKHIVSNNNSKYIEIGATPLFDENNNCIGIVAIGRDITKHIADKDILRNKANFDKLTGLANKSLFEDRLKQSIINAKKNHTKFALFFIDLNKFKWVNDNLGHSVGDTVLQNVAKTVSKYIRKDDMFARIGGDEFTIIMENITHRENVIVLSKKVLNSIEKPMICSGHKIEISASIGVVIYPDDSKDEIELLKYADMAMYSAKEETEGIKFYSSKVSI